MVENTFALLDGAAVILWYNSAIEGKKYIYLVSSFYALYTVMIALGVGLRDKVKNTDSIALKSKFNDLFIYGFLNYAKGKFRKSKDDKLLSIANEFELLLSNFDLDLDKEIVSNLEQLKRELNENIKRTTQR